jgi:hypothetical protein
MNRIEMNVSTGVKTIVPYTAEEEAAWAAEVAAYEAQKDIRQAESVRDSRDTLLAECDWVAIKAFETGTPVSAQWAAYRQALRDITTQEGFPWTITWPVKP